MEDSYQLDSNQTSSEALLASKEHQSIGSIVQSVAAGLESVFISAMTPNHTDLVDHTSCYLEIQKYTARQQQQPFLE